jgi:large subunit ribosomal protein L15
MSLKRRKKNSRLRGSTTHGWGAMKKHRGAGHRGGRGNAGSGKRGDAKKPSYWAIKNYYGKHGFTSKAPPKGAAINVGHIVSGADRFVAQGMAQKKGDTFIINLSDLGIERLLGTGPVAIKLDVTVESASPRAIEKIEMAGGKVTVTKVEEEVAQASTDE